MEPENAWWVASMPVSMTSMTCLLPFWVVWLARVISREEAFCREGSTACAPVVSASPSTTIGLW